MSFGSFFNFGGFIPDYRGLVNRGHGRYYPTGFGSGFGYGGYHNNPIAAFVGGIFGGNQYYGANRYGYGYGASRYGYGYGAYRGRPAYPVYENSEQPGVYAQGEEEFFKRPDGTLVPVNPQQHHHNTGHSRHNVAHPEQPSAGAIYNRPFATNTNPDIQNLTDRLQDVVASGSDPEKLAAAAQAYAKAAQAFGGPEAKLPVPPQGVIVPAHDGYKGFEVWGSDRIRKNNPGVTHNSPEFLARVVLQNNRAAATAVGQAFAAQSNPPAKANGQPLDIRPPAANSLKNTGAVNLQKLEEQLDAKYPENKVAAIKELQSKLAMNGFGKNQGFSPIDGEIGPLTTAGFAQFAQSKGLDPMNVAEVVKALNQPMLGKGVSGGWPQEGDPNGNTIAMANITRPSTREVG